MLNNGWISQSPVQIYVQRCCEPSLAEPNYPLNLELAEYILQKKANTPREAAMAIANHVNHRNPHVAILAIALLRTLVQAVGYAFHLQIATKEFLNELVRRFPERPPPFPGPVMSRILEIIHEWRETICKESRWKEDLGNIRDMHRLLTFKGYRFKDISKNSSLIQAVSANANLKSPEELENEDREAQQAKLQELIRRGTPRDLQAAQDLMKSLAGANPEAKPDYRSQTLHELEKLQSKVILLNDLLDNVDISKGEKFVEGDAYDQVATVCRQARPKIQKWISDASGESEDQGETESLDTFLHINDLINNVLDRYERFKKGDYSQATPTPVAGGNDLIGLDDEETLTSTAKGSTGSRGMTEELADLFGPPTTSNAPTSVSSFSLFSSGNVQQAPPIPSAGYGFNLAQNQSTFQQQGPMNFSNNGPLMPFGSSTPPPGASASSAGVSNMLGGIALPSTPNNIRSMSPASVPPSSSNLSSWSAPNSRLGFMGSAAPSTMTPQPSQPLMQPQQQQNQNQQQQPSTQGSGKDPFADLVGLF
ncbi:hypothetical protein FRB97_009643 [Tulasnella sp. 331]|nr:hypothetical protein FRB97_009643 [Tulasnella sp. 331]KAG8884416.1 hypothetical protein FRB98_002426 [Tulasnella sp. 332]